MLLHNPGNNDVKAYLAMEKYVQSVKIKSIGLSNFYIDELKDFYCKLILCLQLYKMKFILIIKKLMLLIMFMMI